MDREIVRIARKIGRIRSEQDWLIETLLSEVEERGKYHDQLIRWYQDLKIDRDRLKEELKQARTVLAWTECE